MQRSAQLVLARFDRHLGVPPSYRVTALGNAGGFSGARFWRIDTAMHTYCLRRWPAGHPSASQLAFIHQVVTWATGRGFTRFPRPLVNNEGTTVVEHGSHFWEFSSWLEGKADYHQSPSREKLKQAARALAEFHRIMRSYPGNHAGSSHSVKHRRQFLEFLRCGGSTEIESRLRHASVPWRTDGLRLLQLHAMAQSELNTNLARIPSQIALRPCLRDIWHDHILFEGTEVRGIVDLGAMRYDDPAVDVARLFGSLVGDNSDAWQVAWSAYGEIEPVDDTLRARVATLDRANVVLSGLNWLRWLHLDEREFDDLETIHQRLRTTLARLEHAVG